MSKNAVANLWGYFGKVPTKGDFIKDDLPLDFVSSWQDWQQAVLAVSREQLEQEWTQRYMNAPIWHFALAAQVCGEQAMIGTMLPSVDSVGRYFFFTLARAVEGDALHYWLNRLWSDSTQDLALKVLDDDYQHQEWVNQLQGLELPESKSDPQLPPVAVCQAAAQHLVFEEHVLTTGESLLNQLLEAQHPRACFWWSEGTEEMPPISAVTNGLPAVGQFSAMLDGNWQKWSW